MTRCQCAKCPWKKRVNPRDIPNGYCEKKHEGLANTIAKPIDIESLGRPMHVMACHETHQTECVGWLVHQLGPGNNLALRLAVARGRIDADVRTVGPQHETFEDTLPK